jgi:hypothetical protein
MLCRNFSSDVALFDTISEPAHVEASYRRILVTEGIRRRLELAI